MDGEPQTLFGVFGRQLPRAPCRDKGLHGRTRSDLSCLCSAEAIANDVTGALPAGWIANGSMTADVVVPINGIGTATFTNTAMGTLRIVKNTVGGNGIFDYVVSVD